MALNCYRPYLLNKLLETVLDLPQGIEVGKAIQHPQTRSDDLSTRLIINDDGVNRCFKLLRKKSLSNASALESKTLSIDPENTAGHNAACLRSISCNNLNPSSMFLRYL